MYHAELRQGRRGSFLSKGGVGKKGRKIVVGYRRKRMAKTKGGSIGDMVKKGKITIGMLALVMLLAGCGGFIRTDGIDDDLSGVFHVLWDRKSGLSPERYAISALETRYPAAEFEVTNINRGYYYLRGYLQRPNFFDLAKENLYGDLILFEDTAMPLLVETGYLEPLDAYIDTDSFIRDAFGGGLWSRLEERGNGHIYGIPYGKNVYALYYNTALFDELGLSYPEDGITWEEVFELARHINDHPAVGDRIGFAMADYNLPVSQLHARFSGRDEGIVSLADPAWSQVLAFLKELNDVQGNSPYVESPYVRFAYNRIFMIAGRYAGPEQAIASRTVQGFHNANAEWDMASFPVFADAPDTGPAPAYYYLGIPRTSGRKEEAFRLISYLLSDDMQTENSRNALASARQDTALNREFGRDDQQLAGKRTEAFFRHPEEGSFDPRYDYHIQDIIRAWVPYLDDYGLVLDSDEELLAEYRKRLIEVMDFVEEEKTKK